MLFLQTFKDAKFVVDGNAFQTFITPSTKNFCLMLAVHLGLKKFILFKPRCICISVAGYFPFTHVGDPGYHTIDTIRYNTRCYFNVRSKADMSQLNLPQGTSN